MFSINKSSFRGHPLPGQEVVAFGHDAVKEVVDLVRKHPCYQATPVVNRPDLAKALGVGTVNIKDESDRFGLGSFKALGGAYAVVKIALAQIELDLGKKADISHLFDPNIRAKLRRIGVGCATDGNHGKSLAAGANLLGMNATVFVHEGVSAERIEAIAKFGANIVTVPGNYDDAVVFAQAECERHGWTVVSDIALNGYESIPRTVMQGYTVMVHELQEQLGRWPTHVFLQAGVGGFAAAIAAAMTLTPEQRKPKFIIVEPSRAACLHASNEADSCIGVDSNDPTVMSMLECYTPSTIAWDILSRLADGYVTVDDSVAISAMKSLAFANDHHTPVVAGESGAAGAAGLMAVAKDPEMRDRLGLDVDSSVLLFNTEGPTAPDIYRKLMYVTGAKPSVCKDGPR